MLINKSVFLHAEIRFFSPTEDLQRYIDFRNDTKHLYLFRYDRFNNNYIIINKASFSLSISLSLLSGHRTREYYTTCENFHNFSFEFSFNKIINNKYLY